jgi:hypothetical protein
LGKEIAPARDFTLSDHLSANRDWSSAPAGNLWGEELQQYRSDPITGEVPGIVYKEMGSLREDEVVPFTKPMHTLDVTEAVRYSNSAPVDLGMVGLD